MNVSGFASPISRGSTQYCCFSAKNREAPHDITVCCPKGHPFDRIHNSLRELSLLLTSSWGHARVGGSKPTRNSVVSAAVPAVPAAAAAAAAAGAADEFPDPT